MAPAPCREAFPQPWRAQRVLGREAFAWECCIPEKQTGDGTHISVVSLLCCLGCWLSCARLGLNKSCGKVLALRRVRGMMWGVPDELKVGNSSVKPQGMGMAQ